jgi:hypothetical protein
MFAAHGAGIGTSDQATGLRKTADLGDAGEQLDARALEENRQRIAELEGAIDRAEQTHDSGAGARARTEWDALWKQIGSGAGTHRRLRRAASHRERARVNVTRQIKSAIEAIRKAHPAVGRHLANSIYTSSLCRYAPAERIQWQT